MSSPDNDHTPHDKGPGDKPSDSQFDALEFELVDLDSARGALDELPAGVAYWKNVSTDWTTRRRPANATDRALTSTALAWLVELPNSVRPEQLSQQYPRVVNAMAARWPDPWARRDYLDDLLHDKRGGRTGFSPEVTAELKRLDNYAQVLPGA
jgi:hypothetical protein